MTYTNYPSILNAQLIGTWSNEMGSILRIDSIDLEGELKGNYKSSLGTNGESFPLIGCINVVNTSKNVPMSILVSFIVQWGKYHSLTSWIGHFANIKGKWVLKTKWHLVSSTAESNDAGILFSNKDTFMKCTY